jgi:hypothetical protein
MNKTHPYVAVVFVLCTLQPLYGATRTWTGGGTTPKWSDSANWGGTAPLSGDDLVFPSGAAFGNLINDYPAGTEFHSVSVGAAFLTLSGNAMSLGSGGFKSTASNVVEVDLPISLTALQTWSAGSTVFVEAPLAINTNTVTFDSLLGFIFSADVSGAGAIIVTGGFIGIDAATTFSGVVTINGGDISVFQGSLTAPIVQTAGVLAFSSNGTVGSVDILGGAIAPGNGSSGPNSTIGNSGSVLLGAGARYVEGISAADPSTGFANLHVTGTVNLGGAALQLFTTGLSPGTQFIFIENDGTDPIVGTFAGLPEGAIITDSSGSYRISYVAGTGNDVALTVVVPTTTTLSSSPNPSFFGQSVTLTATVTATGGVPSGTVTFFRGTTTLGTATLGSDGVATLAVSSLVIGSNAISARYSGDNVFLSSTSNTITQLVNTPPANVPTLSWWALSALVCALALAGLFARH